MCDCELNKAGLAKFGWIALQIIWDKADRHPEIARVKPSIDKPGKCGVYAARIKTPAYHSDIHKPCQVITIGQASDISVRLGQFIGAGMGFGGQHSEGNYFATTTASHHLRMADLEISFAPVNIELGADIKQVISDAECALFAQFARDHKGRRAMLNRRNPPGYIEYLAGHPNIQRETL